MQYAHQDRLYFLDQCYKNPLSIRRFASGNRAG